MHLKQFCLVTIYRQVNSFNNSQHESVSPFYFNKKAIYHLFVTGQKPNKMHHCEISFQNLCYARETVVRTGTTHKVSWNDRQDQQSGHQTQLSQNTSLWNWCHWPTILYKISNKVSRRKGTKNTKFLEKLATTTTTTKVITRRRAFALVTLKNLSKCNMY